MSRALKQLADNAAKEDKMTYGSIVDCLGDQGFGLIIVLFALPSALPISAVPGFSFIFGLPIVFVALQIIGGRHRIWLPTFLAKREVNKEKLVKVIKKTLPYLISIEKLLKPRWSFLTSPIMERVHGVVLLLLSLLLLLPIPMSNFIFAGLIILFGLGLTGEDGLCLTIAYLGAILYGVFITSLVEALFN
ncbi:ABC transporter permease [Legionella beliardensis]|uniref:ABC transporter permease n=2 Tax=Legionella beliardensis TaxID=91822 RepID=A0A378I5L8_9GAMM|nr:ABC transporter permease [Legionella beliardensis]